MVTDLDAEPDATAILCRGSHARVLATIVNLTDDQARSPSRLPGWTVGHVLTHLSRNAEGHSIRLEGALRGEDVARYPRGGNQRDEAIAAGSSRPAGELVADLTESQRRLESTWNRCVEAGWPNRSLMGRDSWPTTSSPTRRLREVEMHHVDLGLGYEPSDWPAEYVTWELPLMIDSVLARLPDLNRQQLVLAWLAGRDDLAQSLHLDPWTAR